MRAGSGIPLFCLALAWLYIPFGHAAESVVPADDFMLVKSNRNFYLAVLLPIHERDNSFFGCGPANNTRAIYQLSALVDSLNSSNEAAILRTGISLGLIVIDYCDRNVRAVDQLYRLLSDDSSFPIRSEAVVGVVTVDQKVIPGTVSITAPMEMVNLFAPLRPEAAEFSDPKPLILRLGVAMSEWVKALGDFLDAAEIQLISVIQTENSFGRDILKQLNKVAPRVCVVGSVSVSRKSDVISAPRRLVNVRGQVTLVLIDDPTLIRSLIESNTSSEQVYVINDAMLPSGVIVNSSINAITIGLGRWSPSESFKKYLSDFNPLDSSLPIPKSWLMELWENNFKCSLRNESTSKRPKCTGQETLDANQSANPALHRVSLAVKAMSLGLQNFLTRDCPQYDQIKDLKGCGPDARNNLLGETQQVILGNIAKGQKPLVANAEETTDLFFTYYSRQLYGEKIIPNKLGTWRNQFYPLINGLPSAFRKNGPAETPCVDLCARNCPQQAASFVPNSLDPSVNFRTAWGIVTTTISVLGMLGVIACFAYFIVVVPSTRGTALLDYVILTGIFVVYGCNFAFVASATDATCVLRRFLMGVAYAIVFSAKLVKVVNTWRVSRTSPRSSVASTTRVSQKEVNPSFALLLSLALTSFQLGVAIAWLILSPAKAVNFRNVATCDPGATFEDGLVLSFLYVMFLMALVLGFSFATRKVETYNQECRWIFLSTSLNILLWIVWTLVATLGEVGQRNPAIVVGNLLCATITLMCLFLPKIYLYGTLLRQAKKLDIRALYPQSKRRQQAVTCLYDPLQYGSVTSSCTSVNGSRGGTTNYHQQQTKHPRKNGEEKISSQNQANRHHANNNRYPRLIYDNRSQFQVEKHPYSENGTGNRINKTTRNGISGLNNSSSGKIDYF